MYRIDDHPVLEFNKNRRTVKFTFNGEVLEGFEGEPVIVALRANGVIKLKEGAKHHTPYGPFCMQGRCCSCSMNVNNQPNVMTCVTPLEDGMTVRYMGGKEDVEVYKRLPVKKIDISPSALRQEHPHCDLAIIGAGPAGLEAAIYASQAGVKSVVLFDDKDYLGGQLTLQTHSFFGNSELGASVRGYEIARQMKQDLEGTKVDIRLGSTVVGLYPNNMLAFRDQDRLNFVIAKKVICATGASEKFLSFPGNCLPGVMGAGGAQTFMNIHGVRPGKRVLIVGGGNIGVILAYQLRQANVDVVALVEAAPRMGAYEVHVNKVAALGLPIYTRHTIKRAHGTCAVNGATIVQLDDKWQEIPGSEKFFDVDTICLAVGLSALNELLWQAGCEFTYESHLGEVPKFDKYRQTSKPDILIAGDCATIGEASIARLEGRIAGLKAALDLGCPHPAFNTKMDQAFQVLDDIQSGSFGYRLGVGKGEITRSAPREDYVTKPYHQRLWPRDFTGSEKRIIIMCGQDIPCNPCETSCRHGAIKIGEKMIQPPSVDNDLCRGCGLCLVACPGRAIRMVQYNYDETYSAITIPYEFLPMPIVGDKVDVIDDDHRVFACGQVIKVRQPVSKLGCGTVTFKVEKKDALTALAILPNERETHDAPVAKDDASDNSLSYVCRCEEVTYQDVIDVIRQGYTNVNDIKRIKRVGMGQCRGLSCASAIEAILRNTLGHSPQKLLQVKQSRPTIFRPPLKRITLGEAAKLKFTEDEIALFEGIEHVRTIPQEIVNTYIGGSYKEKSKEACKIVIIGGGISGILTAWWLAKMGENDVTVVEKNFLTSGQTGACLGGIRTGFNTINKVHRAAKGLEVFKNAKELIGEDVGWHEGGYVYLAFDELQDQAFKRSQRVWDESHVRYEYLTNHEAFDRYVPGIDAERVKSLVYFPDAGGANPFKAVYAFAEAAKRMGVRILTGHEAVRIKIVNNRVKGVTIREQESGNCVGISCEHLINTAGTSSVRVAKMAGIDLSSQIWIERHGAFITEKMPLWLDPLVVSYHPELSGYWQQKRMESAVAEGEIVACYSAEKILKGYNTHSYIYFLSRMAKAMLLCQPGMADVGIIRNFAEHYVGRTSGIPIIGESPIKGFWFNIAKKGHGFMCAPGDGYALARTIVEGRRHEWITECNIEDSTDLVETMK